MPDLLRGVPVAKIGYRGGIALVTASSAAVPLVGILTAPLLARGLGVSGRGELSAATAPGLILLVVVSLGMPSATAFFAAKAADRIRAVILTANAISLPLGLAGVAAVWLLSPTLAAGDTTLGQLMVLAAFFVLPQLAVGMIRGAAIGRQEWLLVAAERITSTLVKLALITGFLVAGRLDVLTAVLITMSSPVLAALVYAPFTVRALRRRRPANDPLDEGVVHAPRVGWRSMLGFGTKDWWGALAVELLARAPLVVIGPAAGFDALGLFVVAVTISDVPYLVTTAVRDVVFGASAAERNDARLQATSRSLIVFSGTVAVLTAATSWLWLTPVFGSGFADATFPTIVMLVASVVSVLYQMAAAALRSAGRPGLASWSVVAALMVFVASIWPAASFGGALGAAFAALGATLTAAVAALWFAKADLGLRPAGFIAVRRSDVVAALGLFRKAMGAAVRLGRRRSASPSHPVSPRNDN